jgi:hypothetical protein
MPNVFAAVFHPPTLDNLTSISPERRLPEMKVAIQQAYGQLSAYAAAMRAANPFFIFLAPEYYFVKNCVINGTGKAARNTWTLYTEQEKKQIIEELRALSGRYKRYLISPGTIAWFKPARAPQGGKTKDGWNTAPILYEGKLKHEYDKIFDDGTCSQFTSDVRFQKGAKSQLFTVESLKFGIEVCGDFNEGNLGKEARAESLDLELMLSATNSHAFDESKIARVPVKNGGYFLHADSDKPDFCGAWCLNRGSGSHGMVTPMELQASALFDPWTTQMLKKDGIGTALSSGTVLALTGVSVSKTGTLPQQDSPLPQNNLRSSGSSWLPTPKLQRTNSLPQIGLARPQMNASQNTQPTAYNLLMATKPAQPCVSNTDDSFRIEVKVSLKSGNTGLANKQISFRAGNGRVQDLVKTTNMNGDAETVFIGNKGQPLQISADFNGTTVSYEAKITRLGAGNVSKIGRLQPETVLSMRSYFLPM